MNAPVVPRTVAEQREALVQAAYWQIASEKNLAVVCVAPGRARVPGHWRAEAEERARPFLDVLGLTQVAPMPSVKQITEVLLGHQLASPDDVTCKCGFWNAHLPRHVAEKIVALWSGGHVNVELGSPGASSERTAAFRDALARADALDRFEKGGPHPDVHERGQLPTEREVPAPFAADRDAPKEGPR